MSSPFLLCNQDYGTSCLIGLSILSTVRFLYCRQSEHSHMHIQSWHSLLSLSMIFCCFQIRQQLCQPANGFPNVSCYFTPPIMCLECLLYLMSFLLYLSKLCWSITSSEKLSLTPVLLVYLDPLIWVSVASCAHYSTLKYFCLLSLLLFP